MFHSHAVCHTVCHAVCHAVFIGNSQKGARLRSRRIMGLGKSGKGNEVEGEGGGRGSSFSSPPRPPLSFFFPISQRPPPAPARKSSLVYRCRVDQIVKNWKNPENSDPENPDLRLIFSCLELVANLAQSPDCLRAVAKGKSWTEMVAKHVAVPRVMLIRVWRMLAMVLKWF